MGVVVTVRLSPPAVAELRASPSTAGPQVADLLQLVDRVGGRLRPQHPGLTDPVLARWFVLDGPGDRRAAEAVASALLEHPAVEAAYVKPSAEPPE